ncbi:unnamed protein product [Chrysoparadoxa australica]
MRDYLFRVLSVVTLQYHVSQAFVPTSSPQLPSRGWALRATEESLETTSPVEKLGYDARTGRFYEREIEELCRDEYCAVDEATGEPILLTKGEKERIFLDSIQSFYYDGRKVLEDSDFDKLKEDLVWEGSDVVSLNRQETLFMNAMGAYMKGKPIMEDAEFDALKASLREAESPVAVSTEPKCFIDTGICSSTFQKDRFRQATLYLPVGVPSLIICLGALYELVEPLRHINPILQLVVAAFPAALFTRSFTESVFLSGDPMIAYGACPSCGAENRVFFGNIVGVEGPKQDADLTCQSCKVSISIRKDTLRARTTMK